MDQALELLQLYKAMKIEYVEPIDSEKENISKLLFSLKRLDDKRISVNRKKYLLTLKNVENAPYISQELRHLITQLNMDVTTFSQEGYSNLVCIHPKNHGQIGFFWRFDNTRNKFTNNPGPFVISDLHRGSDGATKIALHEFNALNAKIYLFNTMHPKSSDIPSPSQPRRKISDGAHSRDTLANPFLRTLLLDLFPNFALNVVHGLAAVNRKTGEKRFMELWVINGVRKPFDLRHKSWGALLTIALAQQDFNFGTISVSGRFPGKYIVDKNGIRRSLISEEAYDGNSVFAFVKGPNSDEQIHVVNVNHENKFQRSGRAIHIEHGVPYRFGEKSETGYDMTKRKHFLEALVLAGSWYKLWNDEVHSFANMPDNIREFPSWFLEQSKKIEHVNLKV